MPNQEPLLPDLENPGNSSGGAEDITFDTIFKYERAKAWDSIETGSAGRGPEPGSIGLWIVPRFWGTAALL